MYQVLYRKWRPKTFDDVIGQDNVTKTLINELEANRLSHAYLFTGSRGTGKTTCAKIFAKAVNCLNPQNGNPCNECENCKGIDNGSILDVVEIDAASNNGVDNIRTLRDEANFTPAKAKYRVYIIDEVHMLSTGAFNALLKTLEEPPEHVKFVLATTEVHKIPATILSRCQRFDFKHITPEDIAKRIQYIASQEDFKIDDNAALLVAKLADGAMRDALSILDQCVGRSKEIDTSVVTSAVGMAGREHLFELAEAISSNNSAKALNCLDTLNKNSCDMERLCVELINHFRNYMICKTTDTPQDLIVCTDDDLKKMVEASASITLESILYNLEVLQGCLQALRGGADRRITMEMTLLRLCIPQLNTSNEAILKRLSLLEKGGVTVAAVTSVQPSVEVKPQQSEAYSDTEKAEKADDNFIPFSDKDAPPAENQTVPIPEPIQKSVPQAEGEYLPFNQWPEVLEEVFETDKPLKSFLSKAEAFVHTGKGKLFIKTNSPTLHEMLKQDTHLTALKKAILTITGKEYPLAFVKPKETEKQLEAKKDPLSNLADKLNNSGVDFKIE
ncbi:MAG: DNA polymerase III subunit gamma/tau [Clostridiales bacterium]|nr:DNA polymerase III subunit gamma/tau [Clostridiales bacterium]